MPPTALAILYHDPDGKLESQVRQMLPILTGIFSGIAICASPQANGDVLTIWQNAGALIEVESRSTNPAIYKLGMARRAAVTLALDLGTSHVLYCDGDRIVHWAAHYPDELCAAAERIHEYDFTVLGRTERAFQSHPGVQRDTEGIINTVFGACYRPELGYGIGIAWVIAAGDCGLKRTVC